MTTPPGPDEPRYATGYGGARYPLPESSPPSLSKDVPQAPAGGYPYGGEQRNPYGEQYSPYGSSPAGWTPDAPPPSRPGVMVLGLILMIIAALPFLGFGLLFLFVPLDDSVVPPDVLQTPGLAEAGVTSLDALVAILRTIGGLFTALAVVYLVFVVIGFLGQNWARILVAVMTGGFAVLLLLGVVSALAVDPAGAFVLVVPVLLSVGGVITWFLPQVNGWYAARRTG